MQRVRTESCLIWGGLRVFLVCTSLCKHQVYVRVLLTGVPRAWGMWQCEPSHQPSCSSFQLPPKEKIYLSCFFFYLSSGKYWLSQFFRQHHLRGKCWFPPFCNNLYKVNACLQWKTEQHINVVIDWRENAVLWLTRQTRVAHKSSKEMWSIPCSLLQIF